MMKADFRRAAFCGRRTRRDRLRLLPACALLLAGAALLDGCARGVAVTTVNPNGSWTRKITFHGVKPDKDGGAMGQKIEDAVVLPTGADWKITRQTKDDESIVILERTLPPGGVLNGDITVKSGKKGAGPIMVNEARVTQTAPGVFQYKETLHWKGGAVEELTPDKDTLALIKSALPAPLATDANARDVGMQAARVFWRVLFGPGDPLLSEFSAMMMQPEVVERRVTRRVGGDMDALLQNKFGAQMSGEQRLALTRKIVSASLNTLTTKGKSNTPGGPPNGKPNNDADDTTPPVALIVSVKMPGRITQTNGERDEINGDIYWSLYPQAAALGDVTLSATCDTNK